MRIRRTLPAVDDLEDIKNYLDLHSPHFSRSTIRKLYDGVRSLRSMPERRRGGLKPGTREILYHPLPYIVIYRVIGQTVEVLRIYHGAQNR